MFVKCVQFTLFLGLVASTLGNAVLNRDGLFTQIGNGYYYIAHENYTKWFNAYEDCRRMGSELITIDTIEEWHAINKYLNNMNIMKSYWTSGNDLAETGKHVWFSNGEPITLDIWAPGQPDNYQNREHCDMLVKMFAKCFQFIFILGLVASTLGNAVINRDGLFTKIGNGYYFIAQENYVNWFKAYENCRRMGSELITIDTIEEWHAINKYLNDMNIMKQYWTSGNDIAETGKHVWFSNGEPINLDIWFPGQPDNYNNGEHCDQLGFGNEETVPALNDIACNMPFAYICEASPLHAPQVI
ncbi:uncharacterized protein Dwil_GK23821 [Drosophila willistoni]|uniref:C-type lectin domain-containing protein n=2 Tax=Drosophila willistoni TaxID=7260 RepID=B4MTI8_DROWI|nr:uncharacterized protein Dwil_GK23821 [Drosophila willistoni]